MPVIITGTESPPVTEGIPVAGWLNMLEGNDTEPVGIKDTPGSAVAGIPFCVTKAGKALTVSDREEPMETEGIKFGLPEAPVGIETSVVGTTEIPNGVAVVIVSGAVAAFDIVGMKALGSLCTPDGNDIWVVGKTDAPVGNASGTEMPNGRDGTASFGVNDAPWGEEACVVGIPDTSGGNV